MINYKLYDKDNDAYVISSGTYKLYVDISNGSEILGYLNLILNYKITTEWIPNFLTYLPTLISEGTQYQLFNTIDYTIADETETIDIWNSSADFMNEDGFELISNKALLFIKGNNLPYVLATVLLIDGMTFTTTLSAAGVGLFSLEFNDDFSITPVISNINGIICRPISMFSLTNNIASIILTSPLGVSRFYRIDYSCSVDGTLYIMSPYTGAILSVPIYEKYRSVAASDVYSTTKKYDSYANGVTDTPLIGEQKVSVVGSLFNTKKQTLLLVLQLSLCSIYFSYKENRAYLVLLNNNTLTSNGRTITIKFDLIAQI